jgi:hypothetical protein
LIRRLADDLSINWKRFGPDDDTTFGDETDYFFTGSQQSVYHHMESWLRALTGSFFDGTLEPDSKDIALCMPMNVQFKADYLAITQLGPRDRDWLLRMSQGSMDYGEFFPWYRAGLNANYFLGRALVDMWSNVRWRKAATDREERLIESVLSSLRLAYQMNPELEFPWNEWGELLIFSQRELPDYVKQKVSGLGRIGYRRSRVRTHLPGNWWIETDGSFSEFESDSEGALLSVDPAREIWFTAYSFSADDPDQTFRNMRGKALAGKHELVNENENCISVADVSNENKNGTNYYLLRSSNIGFLCRSVLTLVFDKPVDREWAVRVWKSLKSPLKSQRRSGA